VLYIPHKSLCSSRGYDILFFFLFLLNTALTGNMVCSVLSLFAGTLACCGRLGGVRLRLVELWPLMGSW
jgi:hypothetical protein